MLQRRNRQQVAPERDGGQDTRLTDDAGIRSRTAAAQYVSTAQM